MSPFLTGQGKWMFATGAIFVILGALLREPLLLLIGQIPFALLLVSVASLVPAARALDRRQCSFCLDSDGAEPSVMVLRGGRKKCLAVWLENRSGIRLHTVELEPHLGGDVVIEVPEQKLVVHPTEALQFEIDVEPTGVGRSSLQGFDVVLNDRWGLVAARDYLPCVQVFASYPAMSARRRRGQTVARPSVARAARVVDRRTRSGTDLRELRDYQPGDPLRSVAWKATVRQRRLITREYDDERTQSEYLALDISSSMRAGTPRGVKFEHALQIVAQHCAAHLEQGRRVGLWTFDGSIYGRVDARLGRHQRRRIQRHLVGLKTVVSEGRTLLDGEDLEAALADYLLVQERLDFRRGRGLRGKVDGSLLRRWLRSRLRDEERQWGGGAESYAVVDDTSDVVRRFFRLRGLPLDPPAEVDAGEKLSGFQEVIKALVQREMAGARLTIVSDLCGLSGMEILEDLVGAARRRGSEIRVIAPFTPYYTKLRDDDEPMDDLVVDLFTRVERKDRLAVAQRLEALGIGVRFVGP